MVLLCQVIPAQNLAGGENTQTGAARSRGANLAEPYLTGTYSDFPKSVEDRSVEETGGQVAFR